MRNWVRLILEGCNFRMATLMALYPEIAEHRASRMKRDEANFRSGITTGERSCRLDLYSSSLLVIFLLGGFSGRFGGYGYGYGHGGIGIIGVILIVLVVLLLLGRI